MVFSSTAKRDLQDGAKAFTFVGGDTTAIKEVLKWIESSVTEGKAAMFQSVS